MAYSFVRSTISPALGTAPAPVYGGTPTAGNILIASVCNVTTAQIPTVSDSNGNWTLLAASTTSTRWAGIYGLIAAASQPTTITATRGGADSLGINIYEFTGNTIKSVTGLAGSSAHVDAGASAATTTGSQPSIVAGFADSMIFSTVATTGGAVTVPSKTDGTTGSFTLGQAGPSGAIRLIDAYAFSAVAGSTYNPSFSWTTARVWYQVTTEIVIIRKGFF